MNSNSTFLVFGATGRTGHHFVSLALKNGHNVRALVRSPEKVLIKSPNLELYKGSITDYDKLEELVRGVNYVVLMLGDAKLQKFEKVNSIFVRKLITAMRGQGIKRLLYQAGGFTKPYKENLPLVTWILKNTVARFGGLLGQHKDNEAVLEYLAEQATDIEWIVHRAAIISDGSTKGTLKRSKTKFNLAPFIDCASYNYKIIHDESAIHTYDLSYYEK